MCATFSKFRKNSKKSRGRQRVLCVIMCLVTLRKSQTMKTLDFGEVKVLCMFFSAFINYRISLPF